MATDKPTGKMCCECFRLTGHSYKCSRATMQDAIEDLEKRIGTLSHMIERNTAVTNRRQRLSNFWHGKYTIVKQENNALRRKLWQMTHGKEADDAT